MKSEVMVDGEAFDVWHRDILECIQSLIGDPEFVGKLQLAPERHYTDKDRLNRVYSDVYTGKWWWKIQVCVCVSILSATPNLSDCRLHWRRSSLVPQSFQFLSLLIKPNLHPFEGRWHIWSISPSGTFQRTSDANLPVAGRSFSHISQPQNWNTSTALRAVAEHS